MGKFSGVDNVVSFGKKAAALKGQRARRAMSSDFTNAIPKAREYSQFYETDALEAATYPDPSGDFVLATAHTDFVEDIFRRGDWSEATFDDVRNNTRDLLTRTEDEYFVFEDFPVWDMEYDARTGDLMLHVDADTIREMESVRRAGALQGTKSGELPVYWQWTGQRPWEVNEDWMHSGRVKVIDADNGAFLGTYRSDDFGIPFDDDFRARRDPEAGANWWSTQKHYAWQTDAEATSRVQPRSQREAEEMLRSMYSPEAEEWYKRLQAFEESTTLGKQLENYAFENGIELTPEIYNGLRKGSGRHIDDFLTDPRIDADDALSDTVMGDLINGKWRKKFNELEKVSKEQGMFPASAQTQQEYFNGVIDKIRTEDPARYAKMQEWMGDTPYRKGIIHPDVPGDENAPVLIFHSGRALDLKKMGLGDMELGTFDTSAPELGTHAGDLEQSAPFAGYSLRTHPDHTITGRRSESNVNKQENIAQITEELQEELSPEGFKRIMAEIHSYLNEHANTMRTDSIDGQWDMPREMNAKVIREVLDDMGIEEGDYRYSDLTYKIHGLTNRAMSLAAEATYPLVFRGRRPFRVRDLTGNTADAIASTALRTYRHFSQKSESLLERIVNDRNLGWQQKNQMLRQAFEASGFDHVIYTNAAEGVGRPSLIFWDQRLAKPLYGSKGFDKNSDNWARAVLGAPGLSIFMEEESQNGD